jgi:cobalt/nickel transport system permease protein
MVHRATVLSKLAATALVISTVVVADNLAVLAGAYTLVLITVILARLPVRSVLAISAFPGLFAVLFALSQARSGWLLPAVIIMKALTGATSMILLISTTQYAEVVGFFGRFLPRVVTDGLFMTYSSFFILFGLLDHFMKALRLRGGFQPRRLIKNAGNMASGVGILFVRAYDKSQRLYDVMTIRGYSGQLGSRKPLGGLSLGDLPYTAMAAFILVEAAYARRGGHLFGSLAMPAGLLIYLVGMEAARAWKR